MHTLALLPLYPAACFWSALLAPKAAAASVEPEPAPAPRPRRTRKKKGA